MIVKVSLPWPDKALSPNSRSQWGRIKAVTPAREMARILTIESLGEFVPAVGCPLEVVITFNPPNRRHFDIDGLITRCKPYQDGIFEALHLDDTLIVRLVAMRCEVVKDGRVTIEIGRMV